MKLFLTCIRILNLVYLITEINLNIFHVKQGPTRETIISFLFSFFLYDQEDYFMRENVPRLNFISYELDNMLDILMKLFIIQYADATVLMAESASNRQTLLDKFHLYCDIWKMNVNVDKTEIVVFSKERLPRNLHFNHNGTNID